MTACLTKAQMLCKAGLPYRDNLMPGGGLLASLEPSRKKGFETPPTVQVTTISRNLGENN
jgi:hypothetical protein